MTLIKNSQTREPDLVDALERATQRPGQDPEVFHSYLDSLEKSFPRESEEKRARYFFGKLMPDLKDEMKKAQPSLPTTRSEMVALVVRHWSVITPRKRKHPEAGVD